MSYDLTNDADAPPGPIFPGISAGNLRRLRKWSLAAVGLALLLLLLWWLLVVYTDWLWFGRLGFRGVYAEILLLRAWLFVGGTLVSAGILIFNLYLTALLSRGQSVVALPPSSIRLLWATIIATAGLTVLIASPIFGASASNRWETFLLFFNRVPFGVPDPQFGLDVSFYITTLHLLNFIQGWFLGLIITVAIASFALYATIFALRGVSLVLTPRMLNHVAGLGLALMLAIAANHVLDVYGLALSGGGVVAGATYTDVHVRVPVLWFLTVIALLSAAGFVVSRRFVGLRLMVGSFSLWVVMALLAGVAYPALFQRFQVAPGEFSREEPFIQRNLEATRAAYHLDQVRQVPYPAAGKLDAAAIEANRGTVDNIRLWDLSPLRDAYNQLQFMELYYSFLNMDSDRYQVDGRLRQVMVAARELDSENLPPDSLNWVNQRLQYTHGYGVAMSPATRYSPREGRPHFLIQDIPIRGSIPVTRPEIYYGESPGDFAIVNSAMTEVNPDPDFQRYEGSGGVSLGSAFSRFAHAIRFGDINILLSDQVTPQSRIQYRRQIGARVGAIAPFLKLDRDPYPVVDDAGKLWWIQDTFTATNRYPYSTSFEGRFNYIRNSVKVVVDAYNGGVNFYVIDGEDPLVQMYRKAFPDLFQDFEDMPPSLQPHIRYPIDLFSAQASMFLRYHVTDPQVFFNQADQWAIPLESRFGKLGAQVAPSYQVMRLPGEDSDEFVLVLPFTPAGEKKNLVGLLAARNDPLHYGELVSYRFPDDRQIDGPSQVEARIENDQQVSQQFTLWVGASSQIIRGQLLVIPIEDTIIYVEPLYLQSEGLAFPELKKIIVADGSDLVMADTIDEGLSRLVGVAGPASGVAGAVVPDGAAPGTDGREQIQTAVSELQKAVDDLQEALENLRESLGGG